jgi:hypothetical protein
MPDKRRRSYVLCMAMRCDLRVLLEEESAWFETCAGLSTRRKLASSPAETALGSQEHAQHPVDEVSWHETCVRSLRRLTSCEDRPSIAVRTRADDRTSP